MWRETCKFSVDTFKLSRAFLNKTTDYIKNVSLDDKIYTDFSPYAGAIFNNTLSISDENKRCIFDISYYDSDDEVYSFITFSIEIVGNGEIVFDFENNKLFLNEKELDILSLTQGTLVDLNSITVISLNTIS